MRIALCQIDPTIGRLKENTDKIIEFIQRARRTGAEFICFPELAITGYPPQDMLERPAFIERASDFLQKLLPYADFHAVLVGYPRPNPQKWGKRIFNSAALLYRKKIAFIQNKTLLPTYDVFDESRYFEKNRSAATFNFKGIRIGITICEDIWNDEHVISKQLYPENPIKILKKKGAEIILNISASPFSHKKSRFKREMIRTIAQTYHLPILYTNTVGANDSIIFDGGSFIMDSQGDIVHQAAFFEEDIIIADVLKVQKKGKRSHIEITIPSNDNSFTLRATSPSGLDELLLPTETEMIWSALVLGIRDYFKKCGFRKALIGLSGGIDSALVAVLAAHALGPDHVMGVLMPSPYSSPGSINDALTLARNLSIKTDIIRIDNLFKAYKDSLHPIFKGHPEDVTEENIQARIRGNILMAISNKFSALVLSTGNKSEIAMGYCTLYGDMSGGLAVIGDVYKSHVYELCRYANQRRQREIIPRSILEKAPSAELRPNQKDEDSLPPYAVLDPILEKIIEEQKSYQELSKDWVPKRVNKETLEFIFHQYTISEYKRQQAPLILKVTQKAFGFGRRFPIAAKTDY